MDAERGWHSKWNHQIGVTEMRMWLVDTGLKEGRVCNEKSHPIFDVWMLSAFKFPLAVPLPMLGWGYGIGGRSTTWARTPAGMHRAALAVTRACAQMVSTCGLQLCFPRLKLLGHFGTWGPIFSSAHALEDCTGSLFSNIWRGSHNIRSKPGLPGC